MRKPGTGGKDGAGSRHPRSLFRAALLTILLLILLFLLWVAACVPPAEGPDETGTGVPERTELEPPALVELTALFRSREEPDPPAAAEPEQAGTAEVPEETPAAVESTPAPAAVQSSGTKSGALKKGMLGVLTYKKKSVGIRPDIREETLLKGPGWVPESALPGEGMAVIFGHRNRNHLLLIRKIREGDTLTFTYADGRVLTYRVRTVQIFETTSEWRLPTESGDVLVIATCYPFQYTGSAPGKFQVIANRIG